MFLKAPPNQVALHFSEALEPKFSHFFVTVPSGTRTEATATVQGKDAILDLGSLVPQGVAAVGSYTLDGQVLSVDGHQSGFRLMFTVQNAAEGQSTPNGGTPYTTGGSGGKQSPGPVSPAAPAGQPDRSGRGGIWVWAVAFSAAIAIAIALAMGRRRS